RWEGPVENGEPYGRCRSLVVGHDIVPRLVLATRLPRPGSTGRLRDRVRGEGPAPVRPVFQSRVSRGEREVMPIEHVRTTTEWDYARTAPWFVCGRYDGAGLREVASRWEPGARDAVLPRLRGRPQKLDSGAPSQLGLFDAPLAGSRAVHGDGD